MNWHWQVSASLQYGYFGILPDFVWGFRREVHIRAFLSIIFQELIFTSEKYQMPRLMAEVVSGGAGREDELDLVSRNILILSNISDKAFSGSISVRVKETFTFTRQKGLI